MLGLGLGVNMSNKIYSLLPINWNNTTNTTVSNDGYLIQPSGGTDAVWTDRNPYSDNLSSGLVFDIKFKLLQDACSMGIALSTDNDANPFNMYCRFYRTGITIQIYEAGVQVYVDSPIDLTKECRIVSNGTIMYYYYNSALVYTSLVAPDSSNKKIKCSFLNNSGNGILITNLS